MKSFIKQLLDGLHHLHVNKVNCDVLDGAGRVIHGRARGAGVGGGGRDSLVMSAEDLSARWLVWFS